MSSLKLDLKTDLSEIPRLAAAVESHAEGQSWPMDATFKINLALEELVTNVISYGFADAEAGVIDVSIDEADGAIRIVLTDNGRPFDPLTQATDPDLEAGVEERQIGGLGIHLVKEMMDSVDYERRDGFNQVRLTKRIDP